MMVSGDFMGWCKPTTMKWVTNLNIRINHLGFELNGQHIWAKHKNMETIVNVFVNYDIYFVVVTR
jgi:hypothetical protein